MSLITRTLSGLEKRRNNLLSGGINSIPTPFKRFEEDFIGIEQATYYCITSFTKGGKTQFASYTFIYHPLLYAYLNKDKVSLKILYFALEETPERVTQRFMSFLLFRLSNGKIRISPKDLRSSNNERPLDKKMLDILNSEEYLNILTFLEETIIFSNTANPTGIYKECKRYAEETGKIVYKKSKYKDEFGQLQEVDGFDYYIPNDPKAYKLIVIDHIGLVDTERNFNLKQSMDKLSEYLAKDLRNKYFFSPVVIQQQNFDSEGNESFSLGRIRPSAQSLGDSKYISRDCNILLGLFSPFRFELPEYKKYDITKFKDNIRFLEVLVNRDGEMGGLLPLFFDGATCTFYELPKPEDTKAIQSIYNYLDKIRQPKQTSSLFMMFSKLLTKKKK